LTNGRFAPLAGHSLNDGDGAWPALLVMEERDRNGSVAGFRGATFETSWRLSKPFDFRPKIAVANILINATCAILTAGRQ
jgi:hypothetical protein